VWQEFINVPKSFSFGQYTQQKPLVMTNWLANYKEFPNPTRKLKEGNKGFYILREFFKAVINYPRQTRKLKEMQLQQSISYLILDI